MMRSIPLVCSKCNEVNHSYGQENTPHNQCRNGGIWLKPAYWFPKLNVKYCSHGIYENQCPVHGKK